MITSKQRSYLRSLANNINPIIQIGKDRIDEAVFKQIDEALEARELVKVTMLRNCIIDAREACELVCNEIHAEPVQVIGNKFTVYKCSKKNPTIQLPQASKK